MARIISRKIAQIYNSIRPEIISRVSDFKKLWKTGSEKELFKELAFCLLTPQSKAGICWSAVKNLVRKNLLLNGDKKEILRELTGVRFKYKKAEYILEARRKLRSNGKLAIKSNLLQFKNVKKARDWLVKNIKGMGCKEASHFLRNVGLGENLAILDRHVLRNLKSLGLIKEIPKNLSSKRYLEIEKKMEEFANTVDIPLSHLDFVLWFKETGKVFK